MTIRDQLRRRRASRVAALLLGGALLSGGCGDIDVPEYNNPSIEELENNPTPASVRSAATGLLIGAQSDLSGRTGYVSMLGIVGRESHTLDVSDPRYITELLVGPLTNSGAFGGGLWTTRYANIRMGNIILRALEKVSGFSDAEKEAIRGFVKTIQALDFLLVINARDVSGAPIDVDRALTDELAPIVGKAEVLAHVAKLLDEGRTHLQNGGSAFPFTLSTGFAGFDTPSTFLEVNRALKARVDVYRGDYASALTALAASFYDPAGPLGRGAYHSYGSGSNIQNNLANSTIYAHPSIVTQAETKPGGGIDNRVTAKIKDADPQTLLGVTSNKQFRLYESETAPLPLIRNEELILLAAEALWFTGQKSAAWDLINEIRTRSGGLAEIVAVPGSDADFVTELLKQRRYSLLFEGGHRWIDHRRFGRLDDLPLDVDTHVIVSRFSIPEAECLARELPSPCNLGG